MQHIRVDLGGLLFYRIGDIGNGDAAEALQLECYTLHTTLTALAVGLSHNASEF